MGRVLYAEKFKRGKTLDLLMKWSKKCLEKGQRIKWPNKLFQRGLERSPFQDEKILESSLKCLNVNLNHERKNHFVTVLQFSDAVVNAYTLSFVSVHHDVDTCVVNIV